MQSFNIKSSKKEIIQSKLINTIRTLNGFLTEANTARRNDFTYSANGVYERLYKISSALEEDVNNIAESIEIVNHE